MPRLEITINIPALDADGTDHRARKVIDLWDRLTETQKTVLTAIHDRIQSAVETKYGATARLESQTYVSDGA